MILNDTARQRFKEARTAAGLTQGQLAKASGVSQSTICVIERGTTGASRNAIQKLADHLNIELDDNEDIQSERMPRWTSIRQTSERTGIHPDRIADLARNGQIPGAERLRSGRWLIPETFGPDNMQPVILDSLTGLGNQYTAKNQPKGDTKFSKDLLLREGIMVIHTELNGPGYCNLTLTREGTEGQVPIATEQLSTSTEALLRILRVRDEETPHTSPGPHLITVSAEGDWAITWVQPQPATGWLTILDDRPGRETLWPAGLHLMGPTSPRATARTPSLRALNDGEETDVTIEAYAVDGSHITSATGTAKPRERAPTDISLQPGHEYALLLASHKPWIFGFIQSTQEDVAAAAEGEAPTCSRS